MANPSPSIGPSIRVQWKSRRIFLGKSDRLYIEGETRVCKYVHCVHSELRIATVIHESIRARIENLYVYYTKHSEISLILRRDTIITTILVCN